MAPGVAEGNETSLLAWLFGALPGSPGRPGVERVDLREAIERDHDHGAPPPPADEVPDTPMVRWMMPSTLLAAGKEVVLSNLFSRFADKRELEAALDAAWFDASGIDGPLWVDYASDTGDGFESTYAIASLLGREELEVGEHKLPRGDILVLGETRSTRRPIGTPTRSASSASTRPRGPTSAGIRGRSCLRCRATTTGTTA